MINLYPGSHNSFPVSTFYPVEKVISGDDDLPKRDDIGERRRKQELRVLAAAAVKSEDDHGGEYDNTFEDDEGISVEENGDTEDTEDSEDEFYKQVKQQRAAKLAPKAEKYTRYVSALHQTCSSWICFFFFLRSTVWLSSTLALGA